MKNFSNSNKLSKLIDIGISLSKEKNINILLEKILNEARVLSNSDGGTVYLISNENQKLSFEIMQTESLDIRFGGSAEPVPDYIYPVKLYNEDGTKNLNNVSAVCALKGKTINIKNAYENDNYDFSGVKGFDKKHNYYSKSFLNVPLKDHKDKVIGVLQLLNAKKDGEIISFTDELVELVEALSSQASVALTNQLLIEEQINYVIQINGKKRALILGKRDILESDLIDIINEEENLKKYLSILLCFQVGWPFK